MYVLDAQRTILFTNAACTKWLGVQEESLVGQRCDYHDGDASQPLAALAARLCPPPEVFSGVRCSAQVSPPAAEDRRDRNVLFLPLGEDDDCAVLAVVGVDAGPDTPNTTTADPAEEALALHRRLIELRREFGLDRSLDRLVGESLAARRVREQVQVAAAVRSRVTLIGPAGCGAEEVARAIHYRRAAPRGRLLPLACPLLDAELLQGTITELKRPSAYRGNEPPGTLLLLEVDQLSPVAQDELAGFLMLPGFELHTLATSKTSLTALAEGGEFRRDLAYALSTIEITLAPLAGRIEDIPLLAQQLLETGNARGGAQFTGFTPEALDMLADYHWPGDVEELAATVGQARGAARRPLIDVGDLPQRLHLAKQAAAHPAKTEEPIDLDALLAEIEAELIRRALERARGNKSKAAELLGVTRARLHRRLAQGDNGEKSESPAESPPESDVHFDLEPDFREIEDDL
ncbi:MAG: helix-turn-helix domain-containing protein [Pirellulaceae bacterium]